MKKLVYSMFMFAMAAFTLAGCSDVPAPYGMPDGSDDEPTEEVVAQGTGTADDPFNVAGANKYIADGGDASAEVYVKGKITDISDMSTSYGNCTYTISDDGNNSLLVYRGYGLNGEKFTTGEEIKVGDEVVVKGKLINYNGTFEFAQGNSIVSINNSGTGGGDEPGGEGKGDGTLASPYNVAKAQAIIAAGTYTSDKVYISGTISEIEEVSTSFGNATYFISDDGTTTGQLEVFRGYYLGGEKFTAEDQIKVGDKVIIYGALTKFYETPEVTQGNQIYSLNGKTAGGTDEPGDPATGKAGTVTIDGLNVTLTAADATAGTETITVDLSTLGYANQEDVKTITLSDGTTITFDSNGEKNGPKYYDGTKGVRVYMNNTITFNGKAAIANVVFTCDSYSGNDYVGNDTATLTTEGNTMVYTNVFTGTSGGGVQLRIKTITITYAK